MEAVCRSREPVGVVGIHHAGASVLGREQRRLGFEVSLHREVEIEVVLTQIGEHGDVVAVTVHAMLHEAHAT